MIYFSYPIRGDRKDIFSASDDNYFMKADNFTYLCSYEEAELIDKQNIFLGADLIITYKRLAVIKNGAVYYMNKDFSDGNLPKGRYKDNGFVIICDMPTEYYIHSWKKHYLSYELRDDSEYNKALKVTVFSTPDKAVEKAISLSEATGNNYVVACWFNDFNGR